MALSSIAHRPAQAGVRVAVLALGLFCYLVAYLIGSYFGSYDGQWSRAPRIYAVFESLNRQDFGLQVPMAPRTSPALAEQLAVDVPELEAVARYRLLNGILVTVAGESQDIRRVAVADPGFLETFDFQVISGELSGALVAPNSAVITESVAEKWFGTADPVGRTLTLKGRGTVEISVDAVIREPPLASHLGRGLYANGFDLLANWDQATALAGPSPTGGDAWYALTVFTYVVLPADGSLNAKELNQRLSDLLVRHAPPISGASLSIEGRPVQAISAGLLQDAFQFSRGTTSFLGVLNTLLIFAAAVLCIACVNFINIQTASASGRAREIGIRRTLGAKGWQILLQDLFRTGLLVVGGVVAAVVALPVLRGIVPGQWSVVFSLPWANFSFWIFLVSLVLAVTVLAGLYPGLVLARVEPVRAIRLGTLRGGTKRLRSALIGSQFALATALMATVFLLYAQRDALREGALGRFDDQYVFVPTPAGASMDRQVLATEILRGPGIRGVTGMAQYPWAYSGSKIAFSRATGQSTGLMRADVPVIGNDYFSVMNIPLLAGRTFSRERDDVALQPSPTAISGSTPPIRTVLDRRAARALGWTNPTDAVGQAIYGEGDARQAREIIGVVDVVPIAIADTGSDGVAYHYDPARAQFTIVRISAQDVKASLTFIDSVLTTLAPNNSLVRRGPFLDQIFDALYQQFEMINKAIAVIATLAGMIAGIGLVGLASYVTAQRTREIGLRKCHGASSPQILRLLLFDFLKPVLIANLVAPPIVIFAVTGYLDSFSVHVPVTPVPFLFALGTTLIVACAAVGARVLYAAAIRPSDALRYE